MMEIDINPAECYGCEYLDGDDWRCTASEDQCTVKDGEQDG